ncbi:MAG: toll/interleukin-1 receptor domain-containing protein [Lachnospiraceae bacterium]|nr:toll/interleukin-1 receptor domain-containing protein [Lachnospiraceae bacterium]
MPGTPEKLIFISHSSKDHDFAQRLTDRFEEAGMCCWIAPRDIPYGDSWAGQISDAIETSRVMIFIFSENSNQSQQVLREIQLALENGLTVITLRISDLPYNRALNYYLSTLHWAQLPSLTDEAVLAAFVHQVRGYLTGSAVDPTPGSALQVAQKSSVNIDESLEDYFRESFSPEARAKEEKPKISPMRQKLLNRVAQNYGASLEAPEPEQSHAPSDAGEGMYFSYPETEGTTFTFVVDEEYLLPDYERVFRAYPCGRREFSEDGRRYANFSIPTEHLEDGSAAIILLTYLPERSAMIVNMGLIEDNNVRIAKTPKVMQTTQISGEEQRLTQYKANKESATIIMDIDTMQPVERYRAYDASAGEWSYYMDLYSGKRYFSFQLNNREPGDKARPYEIGKAYYLGFKGLPKNIMEAAEWLDRSGTASGYRLLAEIFRTDPLLASEEDAAYYEQMAEELSSQA